MLASPIAKRASYNYLLEKQRLEEGIRAEVQALDKAEQMLNEAILNNQKAHLEYSQAVVRKNKSENELKAARLSVSKAEAQIKEKARQFAYQAPE